MRIPRFATLALTALVALLLAAREADAGQRRARKGAPKSGQAERTVTRSAPDGSARTSSQKSTWQRGDGKWSRDTLHTGPGGKTATTQVEGQRSENGYTRRATHSGPQGTTTVDGQGTWDPVTKTWTRQKRVTRPDGSTAKTDVTTRVTPSAPEPAPAQ